MASLNQVNLIGNLTKDPESRQAGTHTVCSFSIAINRRSKGQDGQQKDEVSFIDCESWDKTADLVMQYCSKGKQVLVQGSLKQDRWQTTDGQNRSKLKVIVNNVQFLGPKPEGQGEQGQGEQAGAVAPGAGQELAADPDNPF